MLTFTCKTTTFASTEDCRLQISKNCTVSTNCNDINGHVSSCLAQRFLGITDCPPQSTKPKSENRQTQQVSCQILPPVCQTPSCHNFLHLISLTGREIKPCLQAAISQDDVGDGTLRCSYTLVTAVFAVVNSHGSSSRTGQTHQKPENNFGAVMELIKLSFSMR